MLWIPTQIPQEKLGYLDSRRIAWSENAAVLFGRLGVTGFILQGVYWIMLGLLAQG